MHDMHTLASLASNDRAVAFVSRQSTAFERAFLPVWPSWSSEGGKTPYCLKMRSLRVEHVIVCPVALAPSASTST